MSPKNEIAPFSLCPTWFLKIVPPSGHYPQQKNSPAFLFTQKSVKMRPSSQQVLGLEPFEIDHCTMGQAVEIDILEVHKSKQILHAHL